MNAIESSPLLTSETLAQNPATFKIVLCDHELDNVDAIAESLNDCDVVALECVDPSLDLRKKLEVALNSYIGSISEDHRAKLKDSLDSGDDGYFTGILKHFIGSGKSIKLIDVGKGDEGYYSHERSIAATEETFMAMENLESNSSVRSKFVTQAIAQGISNKVREDIMAKQLEEIAASNHGKRIGAAIGAIHTGVYHALSDKFETSREFVLEPDERPVNPGQNIQYDYYHQLMRIVRFGVAGAVSNNLVDRAQLQYMRSFYSDTLDPWRRSEIERLSDDEVKQALDSHDKRKTALRAKGALSNK